MTTARACPSTKTAKNPNENATPLARRPVNNLLITCRKPSTTPVALRISSTLRARAQACADAVSDPLGRWLALTLNPATSAAVAIRNAQEDPRHDLRDLTDLLDVPRASSNSVRVDVPAGGPTEPAEIRARVAAAVIWCERRNPRTSNTLLPHVANPVAGTHYRLASQED